MKVYGILNCDSVKKGLKWLDTHDMKYTFHNFKTDGVTKSLLSKWVDKKGWDKILNLKSTTYRKLLKEGASEVTDKKSAIEFMLQNTSSIKRPLIEDGGMLIAGFNETEFQTLIKK